MTTLDTPKKALLTATVILIVAGGLGWKYWHYLFNPGTRSGQVRAQVIQITPRVSGTIVDLRVEDNQFVKTGELLFQIDPRTYESTLEGMKGLLAETEDEIEALAAQVVATAKTVKQYEAAIERAKQKVKGHEARLEDYRAQFFRYQKLVKTGAASEERLDRARADFADSEARLDGALAELLATEARKLEGEADLARVKANLGAEGPLNARRRTAKARVHSAELNVEFTEVRAPVDGYVTNLRLRLGDHAVEDQAILALVDVDSYWVYGYFKEFYLEDMRVGDRANVVLMGYPDTPLKGRVAGRGWGIFRKDGSTAQHLLPKISATYQWVRQPRRIPVRIELDELPEGVDLVVGATATVQIMTGTAGSDRQEAAVSPVPEAAQ